MKSRGTPTNSPHLPQLEKAHVQQWRPGAAKKKSFKKDFLDTTQKAQSIKEKKVELKNISAVWKTLREWKESLGENICKRHNLGGT